MDAEERLLRAEMEKLDKESHPEVFKEIRGITIDLALFADRVILDGKQYYPGRRYEVPKDVYDVLCEVEQSTFRHEQEIRSGSGSDAFYRRERNITLNTRTGEAVAAQGQPVRY